MQSESRMAGPRRAGEGGAAIEQFRRRVVGLAVKLVWRRDDAEDLAQEAFRLAAASGISPGEGRYLPWLLRTVGNLCLNHRRRGRRQVPLEGHQAESSGGDAVDRLETAERLDRVRNAVAALPDQQRLALVLRTMEQMSYEEIASVMELSVPGVRTHVHLARRKLVELLGEDE